MKTRDLIRILKENGFTENKKKGKGGHIEFNKQSCRIYVPTGSKHRDVCPGTLNRIFKDAGLELNHDTGEITCYKPRRNIHLSPGTPQ